LKEDEEFRLAIAGLLGLDSILLELKKLREDFLLFIKEQERRWEETYKRLDRHEEEFKRVWESIERLRQDFLLFIKEQERRWEENNRRWEENVRRWEENSRRWEEAYKRFEAIENELKRLREDFNRAFESLSRRVDALGARWGLITEEAFREGMRGIIQKLLGVAEVSRWSRYDSDGEVYGRPSVVEVDLLIKDGVHILVEAKSSISKGDVLEFLRIGRFYEKVCGVKPRLVMISPYVDVRAYELAKDLGIEVYTG
jgi:hypothetical protein